MSEFLHGKAAAAVGGGAITLTNEAKLDMLRCQIARCESSTEGGAIYALEWSTLKLHSCRVGKGTPRGRRGEAENKEGEEARGREH